MLIKREKIESYVLGVIILLFLIFGVSYIFINPLWAPPDELAHFAYTKYIIEQQKLPVYEHHLSIWESHQPPLYYLLGVPFILIFQHQSFNIQVYALRFFSLILGALTVFISYLVAKKLFPDNKYLKICVPALVALLPMFSYISSAVNNDNLANFLGSLILLCLIIILEKPLTKKVIFLSSLIIALALLTKTTLIPLALVFFIVLIFLCRKQLKNLILYFIIPLIIITGWWFVRNMVIYGDLLGWSKINEIWAFQYKNIFVWQNFINWCKVLFKSFFGIFGKLNIALPQYLYLLFALILIISLVRLLFLYKTKFSSFHKKALALLFICSILTLAGVFLNSIKFYQPQGRYLFPVVIAFSLFFVLGILYALPRKFQIAILSSVMIIFLGINILSVKTVYSYYKRGMPFDLIDKNLITDKSLTWYNQGQLEPFDFSKNTLKTKSQGKDPRIASPDDLRIESNRVSQLVIEMKIEKGTQAQIFWRAVTDMGFFEKNSYKFNLIADNQWHTYNIPLEKYFNKPTLISQFRIDPTNKVSDIEIGRFILK